MDDCIKLEDKKLVAMGVDNGKVPTISLPLALDNGYRDYLIDDIVQKRMTKMRRLEPDLS